MSDGESPEPVERGRYAAYAGDPTGLVIARRVNLCQRCLDCDCGELADEIDLTPRGVGKLLGNRKLGALAKVMIPGGGR